jgi:pimeloyl-ACP methyl ester carboxylesterase
MQEPSKEMVDVRGYKLRVSRSGNGRPLLLLGDFVGPQGWQPFMDTLALTHDVILPEHPGFGGQALPGWLDNISDLANFYLDLLDTLGLDHVKLLGLGCGGWIAADLATRNAARIDSLILCAPAGLHIKGVPQIDTFLLSEEEGVLSLFHDRARGEPFLAGVMAPELEDARLQNYEVNARLTWNPRSHDPDLRKWLHRISTPTLVIWGAQDRIFPQAYGEEWRSLVPGSRLEILENCGHAPHLEAPAAFIRLVDTFCSVERVAP